VTLAIPKTQALPVLKGRAIRWRRLPWVTLIIVVAFLAVAAFAPLLTPYDPYTPTLTDRLQPPDAQHWLGTDSLGRDMASRLFYGARVTLLIVLTALGVGACIGSVLGVVAGYFRGVTDIVISRVVDAMLAFPSIFFGLLLAVTLGPGRSSVVIAISLVIWARFARVVRAEVLTLRERDFIAQAKVNGCSPARVILTHVAPNLASQVMILVSINIGYVITLEATLSFLGAGVPPPTPSWGGMIAEGQNYLSTAWWISAAPGVAILLTVLAFNLLGDWLRDYFDPQTRDRV
jgi:peptide/nickel transport system permease protein